MHRVGGVVGWTVAVVAILAYCTHMNREGLEYSTMASRLAAITFTSRVVEHPDP